MKDNFPNYLNYHGIDPGRVEPARVDNSPGNDSIRDDRMRAPRQTEMTLETAIDILKFVEGNIYERIAIRKVIEALSLNDKLITACRNLIRDSSPFEPDKVLCNVLDIRRLLTEEVLT